LDALLNPADTCVKGVLCATPFYTPWAGIEQIERSPQGHVVAMALQGMKHPDKKRYEGRAAAVKILNLTSRKNS
jgi:hypothetical protein